MRGLSRQEAERDEHVHRCTCGAWRYVTNDCAVCATLRGVSYGLSTNRTTSAQDNYLP